MVINKTQLLAILAIVVQFIGQLGFSEYAELLQTVGTAIISILVLFGLIQTETIKTEAQKLKVAMLKAKLIKE